jgi:hypothetical protein
MRLARAQEQRIEEFWRIRRPLTKPEDRELLALRDQGDRGQRTVIDKILSEQRRLQRQRRPRPVTTEVPLP